MYSWCSWCLTHCSQSPIITTSPIIMRISILRRLFLLLLCCYYHNCNGAPIRSRGDFDFTGGSSSITKSLFRSKTAAIIGAACWYSLSCLQIVTSGDECLVERFGKYHRKLSPGWHLVFKPFETVSFHVTTREQVLDVPPQQCYTLDNAPLVSLFTCVCIHKCLKDYVVYTCIWYANFSYQPFLIKYHR